MNDIDKIVLNFDEQNVFFMNLTLGFIMFGVALKLTPRDFFLVFTQPKAVLLGFFSQFIALPFLTFLVILIIKPYPSIALGMMLVAACPGGNISNFMTALAKGNVALSVSMTAIASLVAVVMTPLNISLWGGLYAPTASLLQSVHLDFWEMVKIVAIILMIPMIMGMLVRHYLPKMADWLHPITHYASIIIFATIIVFAFKANFDIFLDSAYLVILIVLLHNALALVTGYGIARIFKLSLPDQKTLTIETGIQNSGLGLGLIFTFFGGMGGMALVAGCWGIWHIISGLSISYFFKSKA